MAAAQVKAANPDLKTTELAKLLGEKWRMLSAEDKAVWEKKAADEKQEYESATSYV